MRKSMMGRLASHIAELPTRVLIGVALLFSSPVLAQNLDALAERVRAGGVDAVLELGRSTDPRAKEVLRVLQAEASDRGHSLGWPLVKALARQGEKRALLRIAEEALFDLRGFRIQALESLEYVRDPRLFRVSNLLLDDHINPNTSAGADILFLSGSMTAMLYLAGAVENPPVSKSDIGDWLGKLRIWKEWYRERPELAASTAGWEDALKDAVDIQSVTGILTVGVMSDSSLLPEVQRQLALARRGPQRIKLALQVLLVGFGDESSIFPMVRSFSKASPHAQSAALRALFYFRTPGAIRVLCQCLNDTNRRLKPIRELALDFLSGLYPDVAPEGTARQRLGRFQSWCEQSLLDASAWAKGPQ